MTKTRLELFSDGVFAIVLTLLVIDLHVPADAGLKGLAEIAPALLVHAGTFFLIGMFWLQHHNALARVTEIHSRTLALNLLALFWITLLPFGAKTAAEHPLHPLGASMIAATTTGYFLSFLMARLSARSTVDDNPRMRAWRRGRLVMIFSIITANLAAALLAWVSPWFGYVVPLASAFWFLCLPAPQEVEQRIEAAAAEAA
jgi:uncharacterized membrane protein